MPACGRLAAPFRESYARRGPYHAGVADEGEQCLVWHRADQFDLMREVVALAGLKVAVAGTPERARGVADLWGPEVKAHDDLRAAIAGTDDSIGLVLLADPAGFGEDSADASAVESVARRGGRVVSFEPLPPTVHAISAGWGANVDGTPLHAAVGFAGAARATPSIRAALDALEHFGAVMAFAANCTAGPGAGSLGARLLSAMELVYFIAGEPESISASSILPRETGRDGRLHELRGTMTANIRFSDRRTATVLVSAATEPWQRGITILGEAGRMRVWDEGFSWTGPDGSVVDEHRSAVGGKVAHPAARHIAAAVIEAVEAPARRVHANTVLAMAETAMLSVRTGSAESPETLRRVAERP